MARAAPLSDTSPEAREMQARLLANLTLAERAARARDLTLAASLLALAGLRRRHPQAPEPELLLRLAVLRLGPDIVAQVYSWRAPDDGT